MLLRPGSQVGPYVVAREIARGGQGAVLEARDREGRVVALKLLLDDDEETEARFMREAEVLGRLQHPNLIRLLDRGRTAGGVSYLVMELVRGQSLSDWVRGAGQPPLDEVIRVMESTALALHYCHEQGLVHRDLKPQNLLLEAETGRVVVVDFGLVRRNKLALAWRTEDRASLTQEGSVLGTPAYMAPEQISPEFGHLDRRADVYGLGATLFFLLTGEPPFRAPGVLQLLTQVVDTPAPDPRNLRPDLPRALAELCLTSLAKDPSERPSTAQAFAAALGPAPQERSRGPLIAVGLVGLLVAGSIGAWVSQSPAPSPISSPSPANTTPLPTAPGPTAEEVAREVLARAYRLGQGTRAEQAEGIRLLEELAASGSTEAKFRLGMAHDEGRSPEGLRWIREAAEAGHAKAAVNLGVSYDKGQGVETDWSEAERWYRVGVERGVPEATTYLGAVLVLRTKEPRKQAEGLALLKSSAARGDLQAILALAHCAKTGQAMEQDYTRAFSYYELAVAEGHPASMFQLAVFLDKGLGVPEDSARAYELFRRAAEAGERGALLRVAEALFQGRGVELDRAASLKWFERAAEFDDGDALARIGVIHMEGPPGVPSDPARAVTYFRRGALIGHTESMYLLGQCLIQGRGVVSDRPKGTDWIRRAAESDHPAAMYYYSVALKKGAGVAQDQDQAKVWLLRAARKGNPRAMGVYGAALLDEEGTRAKGVEWLTRAATEGEPRAMYYLGVCYSQGRGVPRDREQAKEWLRRAADAPRSPLRAQALASLRSLEAKER